MGNRHASRVLKSFLHSRLEVLLCLEGVDRISLGKLDNPANQNLKDLSWRELATIVPLIIMAFWIGLYPAPFFRALDKPVAKLVAGIQAVNPAPDAPKEAREAR